MKLDLKIEALLFYKAAPLNKITLMKTLDCQEDDFHAALDNIRARQQHSALCLLETETDIQLVTAPEVSDFLASQQKEELKADIGKAGAETLAIILYREPITRAEIDRIRGVNSSFILRNLMVRGLIERHTRKGNQVYRIAPQLLQHLGVEQKYDLPQYATFMNSIEAFEHSDHG
jgi:segregation and condensation protein B